MIHFTWYPGSNDSVPYPVVGKFNIDIKMIKSGEAVKLLGDNRRSQLNVLKKLKELSCLYRKENSCPKFFSVQSSIIAHWYDSSQ